MRRGTRLGSSPHLGSWIALSATGLHFETQCMDGQTVTSTALEISNLDGTHRSKIADLHGLTSFAWRRMPGLTAHELRPLPNLRT